MEEYRQVASVDELLGDRVDLYEGLYGLLAAADYVDGNEGHRDWAPNLDEWLHHRA